MIQAERLRVLNGQPMRNGRYVLYWMQQAVRAECNPALEFAIQEANARGLPLVALFGVTERYPEANERHYAFLLEGLQDAQQALRRRGVPLVVRRCSPETAAVEGAQSAALLVTDRGYLRLQKQWRASVAERAPCRVAQVETDVIVPVEAASGKEEFAARTLRPKIMRLLPNYLTLLPETPLEHNSLAVAFPADDALDLSDIDAALARLDLNRSVKRSDRFRGGTAAANGLLDDFVSRKLKDYPTLRRDPSLDNLSHLSPYLHFGHISPLAIALRVQASPHSDGRDAYLEELIVRRELSMNFVHYNPDYDRFIALPEWARKTLQDHAADPREFLYTRDELERAQTHDPYWNAAQQEMVVTGKMHNTMRMYWGKKILEWMRCPQEAFETALSLNNKYELDGRDANSYAGVAWCFGKHDRPWAVRPIFGTVRYMNANGLKRKFDIETYVLNVARRMERM